MMINHTLCFANPLSRDSNCVLFAFVQLRQLFIPFGATSTMWLHVFFDSDSFSTPVELGGSCLFGVKKACWRNEGFSNTMESGDDLPSRAVSSQVLSACGGLTSVFGMGTGGSLQLLSPEIVCTSQTVCSLAPGPFRGLLSHSDPRILKTAQEKLT